MSKNAKWVRGWINLDVQYDQLMKSFLWLYFQTIEKPSVFFFVIVELKSKLLSTLHTLHKKWSFPLRISSANVTRSAVSCGFGRMYWKNPQWETSFFCAVIFLKSEKRFFYISGANCNTFFWSSFYTESLT